MIKTKRLFLAIKIELSNQSVDSLIQLKAELKHEKIRWVSIENLHLTLRFFGETSIDRIPDIIVVIQKALKGESSFDIEVAKLGIFGSRYQPKVIWLGIRNPDLLINLEKILSEKLEVIGFQRDRQNFVPHLSIGRVKQLKDKDLFMDIIQEFKEEFIQESEVQEVILYESILQRTGPIYKIVHKFNLLA